MLVRMESMPQFRIDNRLRCIANELHHCSVLVQSKSVHQLHTYALHCIITHLPKSGCIACSDALPSNCIIAQCWCIAHQCNSCILMHCIALLCITNKLDALHAQMHCQRTASLLSAAQHISASAA